MTSWSLPKLLESVHNDVEHKLDTIRSSLAHPTSKGDASEGVWIELFNSYLPRRYCAKKAFVVDSAGTFSNQIDVVVFDRQYSPLIFEYQGEHIVAAESVYAVFEAKQAANAEMVKYAQTKAASVRSLRRTSLPIPHAGGEYPPKPLHHIYAGLLTLDSDWSPPLGDSLMFALGGASQLEQLEIGCIAAHGFFVRNEGTAQYEIHQQAKHATAFLFRLITMLQACATVPMIDIQAYARWLE